MDGRVAECLRPQILTSDGSKLKLPAKLTFSCAPGYDLGSLSLRRNINNTYITEFSYEEGNPFNKILSSKCLAHSQLIIVININKYQLIM